MVVKIVLVTLIVLGVLIGIIALQPSEYRVSRSTLIAAPPGAVFAAVDDFHKWEGWSPWAKLDPGMKVTYSGPASGMGAVYSWVGNDQVGEGRMTILESHPAELVRIKLEFIKPFASTANTEFALKPTNGGTTVEWTMSGENDFMSKAMCFFMGGMDKMVGPDFEKGLAQMKSAVESGT